MGFLGGGERGKIDLKLPVAVCFALYYRNFRLYHQDFDNDIYSCFSLFLFFQECNIVNIEITLFFIGYLQQFFLIIICFSSSSKNAKTKFWGVPHLLHMCVIFNTWFSFSLDQHNYETSSFRQGNLIKCSYRTNEYEKYSVIASAVDLRNEI